MAGILIVQTEQKKETARSGQPSYVIPDRSNQIGEAGGPPSLSPPWIGDTVSSRVSGDIGRRESIRDLEIRIAKRLGGRPMACGFLPT